MSTSNAERYARYAKSGSDDDERISYLAKAVQELAKAIEQIQVEIRRLKASRG